MNLIKQAEVYKIILDHAKLNHYIANFLPELEDNQKFYCCLFARKKYSDKIQTNDKTQLKRFLATKKNLVRKLRQLEVPYGAYELADGTPVPEESLAVYISVNPRDMVRAIKTLGKKAWDLMGSTNYNIHAEALSCVQKSSAKKKYLVFDIDCDELTSKREAERGVRQLLGTMNDLVIQKYRPLYHIVETRGGLHLYVDTKSLKDYMSGEPNKSKFNIYNIIRENLPVDKDAHPDLSPIVGCTQGGFVPKLL